jgi:hypothetical protein
MGAPLTEYGYPEGQGFVQMLLCHYQITLPEYYGKHP